MKFLVGLLTGLVVVLLIVMTIHLSEPKVQAIKAMGKIDLYSPGPNSPWRTTPDQFKPPDYVIKPDYLK